MLLKIYRNNRCPACGRDHALERVRRGRLIRIFNPNARLMKCRLCLTRFLVRDKSQRSEASSAALAGVSQK